MKRVIVDSRLAYALFVLAVVGVAGLAPPAQSSTAGPGSTHHAHSERAAPKKAGALITRRLTRALAKRNFLVSRGYPKLYTQQDCDRYTFRIMQNCYANDPTSPYVLPVVKSWKDEFVDPATVDAFGKTRRGYSATYRLDPREAIVVFGKLPPPGKFIGLQSYVFTKEWLTKDEPWDPAAKAKYQSALPDLYGYLFAKVPRNPSRIQSLSTTSNSINNVIIKRQSGAAFGQIRYFVITPDRAMDRAVRRSLGRLGVRSKNVFTEPIPPRDEVGAIGPLGLDAKANEFLTGIRYKRPDNQRAGNAWWANLPLTVLRVRERPSSDRPAQPFPPRVPDKRTAVPENVYAVDLDNLARQVCQRWGQPCDPANPDPAQLQRLGDIERDIGLYGPRCRAIGMNCLGDNQDTSVFFRSGQLDPGWIYAVVSTLGTATGNATFVGMSVNDMSKLKGALDIPDTELAGSAASYAGTVHNTDKFFVHYLTRDCRAIASFTDGECTTLTEKLVPPQRQGLFATAVRSYIRPGTTRGPLASEQLKPMLIRFRQP